MQNVTVKAIKKAVSCDDVDNMRGLRQQYGVASPCGCCKQCAKEVLNDALSERAEKPQTDLAFPAKHPQTVCYT